MRRNFFAPVTLLAGLCLLVAGPIRAGQVVPPEPPPIDLTPAAVLYSVEAGLIVLIPSGFELSDFEGLEGLPFLSDLALVDLDDLTHGSQDAYAITGICASDPACNAKILGSGPGGRLPLVDALLSVYDTFPGFKEPPSQPVPEPGTAALIGLGLCALAAAERRRD